MPAILAMRYSVVTFEQQNARRSTAMSAVRVLLLMFLLAITAYGYRQLDQRGILGLSGWQGEDPLGDPLLLLAPTLYLFTAPLLASEVFALLMRPLALIGRWLPSVTGYLGFLSLGREGGQYRTPTYLLVLCLSLGVFYASLAKSADIWLVDRLQYQVGADLTFEPGVNEETGLTQNDMAWLLPASEYMELEGVAEATRVGEYAARVPGFGRSGSGARTRLLGVERLYFRAWPISATTIRKVAGRADEHARHPLRRILVPAEAELLDLVAGDSVTSRC